MLEKKYTTWAYRETTHRLPHKKVDDDWLLNWKRSLFALRKEKAIFEIVAIVFSKCEFLGLLYKGNAAKSDFKDFKSFLDNFFDNKYKKLHNVSGRREMNSEIYSMFRNKILHSGQPVGIKVGKKIIGWWLGYGNTVRKYHFKIDSKGNLNIHCGMLVSDFLKAMKKYSSYLKSDRDCSVKNKIPSARFYESFWATFCPLYYDKGQWMKEWQKLKNFS